MSLQLVCLKWHYRLDLPFSHVEMGTSAHRTSTPANHTATAAPKCFANVFTAYRIQGHALLDGKALSALSAVLNMVFSHQTCVGHCPAPCISMYVSLVKGGPSFVSSVNNVDPKRVMHLV